jgi:nitronate monooxygenase
VDIADRLRLDVPVGQAGMGGGLAGASLAAAVAKAGGLGTIGITTPRQLGTSIDLVREQAPDRAVAVNLLMPFVRRGHVGVCVDARVDVVVLAFGEKRALVKHLRHAGIFVFVMVGTPEQARAAAACGADGLIAQGREAGGHLVGTMPALDFLPHALSAAGASGVIAGTRFLLTHEANASREYQRRIMQADKTIETNLFGFSWRLRHRVVPNAATRRWCGDDGKANALPAALNAASRPMSVLGYFDAGALMRLQSPARPFFTPLALTAGTPDSWVDRAALYAGETALRIGELISAEHAVNELRPC